MTHPRRRPGQAMEDHQAETAAWCGYADTASLNADHDRWHVALNRWLGSTSHALRASVGASLTKDEADLANMEEDAVLAISRYAVHSAVDVP